MKLWLAIGALLAVLVLYPALAAALLAVVGTLAVTAAAQPVVLGFVAGLILRPRITARVQRWTP
ncbi:hypothetical protein [Actinacidiphila oryziradicis]|uniref:Uncharacterized protein n=1 Tax=Actinacidiphila oryziradicis TaxID=2571141 RepID=A0A4U0T8U4_9ACTN|nr:hypothetical protein [Actinacidiphila oryziradicis]TKA11765.1 hypothetical protein FCI23_10575 [Actinacidiphila oryziradicis]